MEFHERPSFEHVSVGSTLVSTQHTQNPGLDGARPPKAPPFSNARLRGWELSVVSSKFGSPYNVCMVLLLLSLACGCALKQGPYSSQVSSVTTDFVKNYTEFFENIQLTGGTAASEYKQHASAYTKMYADLSQLDLYSNHPVNNGVQAQVADLRFHLDTLRNQERKGGISTGLAKDEIGKFNESVGRIIELEQSAQSVLGTSKGASSSGN